MRGLVKIVVLLIVPIGRQIMVRSARLSEARAHKKLAKILKKIRTRKLDSGKHVAKHKISKYLCIQDNTNYLNQQLIPTICK